MTFWTPQHWNGDLVPPFSLLLCSQRNCGKSDWLLSYLVRKNGGLDQHDRVIVFTTPPNRAHYERAIPGEFVHTTGTFEHVFERFESKIGNLCDDRGKPPLTTLWVLDDLLNMRKTKHSKGVDKLFILGRHLGASVVFVTQVLSGVSRAVRRNLDYAVFIKSPCLLRCDRKSIIEDYLGFLSYHEAEFLVNNLKAFESLILDMKSGYKSWQDRVSLYTAPAQLRNFDGFLSQESKHVENTGDRRQQPGRRAERYRQHGINPGSTKQDPEVRTLSKGNSRSDEIISDRQVNSSSQICASSAGTLSCKKR